MNSVLGHSDGGIEVIHQQLGFYSLIDFIDTCGCIMEPSLCARVCTCICFA